MKWKTAKCDLCNYVGSVDKHHINRDRRSNNKYNLAKICPNCHRAIHSGKITIIGWKQTNEGRKLFFV